MSLVGSYSNSFGLQAASEQLYSSYYARFDTATSDHNSSPSAQQSYFPGWSFTASPEADFGSPPPPYTPSPNAIVQENIATTSMTLGAEFSLQTEAKTDTYPPVRPVKRRYTANRKERRRTLSINNAFADLRDCIPNVPADTKLSKIKTLRLATSYIAYLMDVLSQDPREMQQRGDFRAEICRKTESHPREQQETCMVKARKAEIVSNLVNGLATSEKKPKGRTGWPQHVWALELKHDP